jgi:uncharacterized protein YgbK (DUF1537 family)
VRILSNDARILAGLLITGTKLKKALELQSFIISGNFSIAVCAEMLISSSAKSLALKSGKVGELRFGLPAATKGTPTWVTSTSEVSHTPTFTN